MRTSRTTLFGVMIIIVAVGAIAYIYFAMSSERGNYQSTDINTPISTEKIDNSENITTAPDDWKEYRNNDVFNIHFFYPENWTLEEDIRSESVGKITLKGDGYLMFIQSYGGEVPNVEWTHPDYSIGGYKMSTWEYSVRDNEYILVLSTKGTPIAERDLVISVITSTPSREIADRILSHITFLQ